MLNREDEIWMFEYERLAARDELDSKAAYTVFSIMIPLSAGILAAFIVNYKNFISYDGFFLYLYITFGAFASIMPVIIAYAIDRRFNRAGIKRVARMIEIEKNLKMYNHRMYLPICDSLDELKHSFSKKEIKELENEDEYIKSLKPALQNRITFMEDVFDRDVSLTWEVKGKKKSIGKTRVHKIFLFYLGALIVFWIAIGIALFLHPYL